MICPSAMISGRNELGLPRFNPRFPITVFGCFTSKMQRFNCRYNATTKFSIVLVEVHAKKNFSMAKFDRIGGLKRLKSFV